LSFLANLQRANKIRGKLAHHPDGIYHKTNIANLNGQFNFEQQTSASRKPHGAKQAVGLPG